jgi:hypothetical protein
MAKLSKSHNQLALATSIEEGMKAQQTQNRKLAKAQKQGQQAAGNGDVPDGTNGTPPTPTAGTNTGTDVAAVQPSEASASHTNQSTLPATSTAAAHGPSNSNGGPPAKSTASRTNSIGDNSSNTSGMFNNNCLACVLVEIQY